MTKLEKYVVWGSSAAVTATGVVYAWMKYMLHPAEPWAVINHPLEPLVLKLHIITAPILVFGIGMITMRHIWPHFRGRLARGRSTGISSVLFAAPMIVTGYALQAMTSARWLSVVGYVHLAVGVLYALCAMVHAIAIKRSASRSENPMIDSTVGRPKASGKTLASHT